MEDFLCGYLLINGLQFDLVQIYFVEFGAKNRDYFFFVELHKNIELPWTGAHIHTLEN